MNFLPIGRTRSVARISHDTLIERIQRGDEGALGAFFDRYGSLAYSLAPRVVHDATLAEEAVERAFLALWRATGVASIGKPSPRTLIVSLVHRHAIELHRGERANLAGADAPMGVTYMPGNPCPALRALTVEERDALLIAYYGGLTPAERAQPRGASGASTGSVARAALVGLAGLISESTARRETAAATGSHKSFALTNTPRRGRSLDANSQEGSASWQVRE